MLDIFICALYMLDNCLGGGRIVLQIQENRGVSYMGVFVNMLKRHSEKKESHTGVFWCEIYKVQGVNPETGRRKSVEVVEASNAAADVIQVKSGLLPPYKVEKATRPASDAQLEAMRKHGFKPPADLSMLDASIFITRSVEGKPLQQPVAPLAFTVYAIEHNVYIPKYASVKEAQDYLLAALPNNGKEIRELK